MTSTKYNSICDMRVCAQARARDALVNLGSSLLQKLKSFKASLGFYGDLLVLVLVWWMVKEYVPYGQVLIDLFMYLFGALVVFSVAYVLYARITQ